jgi:hypothetical protein
MITWPNNATNAETVYLMTEKQNGCYIAEGRYPVGANSFWHSGIHIYKDRYDDLGISPIISGKVIAYRISDYDKTVKRLNEIDNNTHLYLDGNEKSVYTEKPLLAARGSGKKYILKDGLNQDQQKWFYEKNAKTYFLLQHDIAFIADNSQKKEITFYTLYVNLLPWRDNKNDFEYDKHKDFLDIDNDTPKRIPFYQKFVYKIGKETSHFFFKSPGGNNLFPYDVCVIESEDENKCTCRFENIDETIELTRSDLTALKRYVPKDDTVEAFIEIEKKTAIGKLNKETAVFSILTDDIEAEYWSVRVYPTEITGSNNTGNIDGFVKKECLIKLDDGKSYPIDENVEVFINGEETKRIKAGQLNSKTAYFTRGIDDVSGEGFCKLGVEPNEIQSDNQVITDKINSRKIKEIFVKRDDLKQQFYLRPEKCKDTAAGILLYEDRQNRYTVKRKIGIMTENDEFEFEGREQSLKRPDTDFMRVSIRGKDTRPYLFIQNSGEQKIRVKIEQSNDDQTGREVSNSDLLGYAVKASGSWKYLYDFVLFFTDNAFMSDQVNTFTMNIVKKGAELYKRTEEKEKHYFTKRMKDNNARVCSPDCRKGSVFERIG